MDLGALEQRLREEVWLLLGDADRQLRGHARVRGCGAASRERAPQQRDEPPATAAARSGAQKEMTARGRLNEELHVRRSGFGKGRCPHLTTPAVPRR